MSPPDRAGDELGMAPGAAVLLAKPMVQVQQGVAVPAPPRSEAAAGAAVAATPAVPVAEEHAQLQERLGGYLTGALTANLVYLGDRLGLYAALKRHGPCTAGQLAGQLDLSERYVAEWLRQQASARIVSADEAAEQFWLTDVQADCLVNERGADASPYFAIGGFETVPGLSATAAEKLPQLFRSGAGISYDELDHSVTCGTCRELGVWVRHSLAPCLCSLPGVKDKLETGCKVADVGCGCGEALMAVAAAFPASIFHGYDIAQDALRVAREECARRGLANVAWFNSGEAEERMPQDSSYQLVMTHDAIHDMAQPAAAMAAVRGAVAPDGCWVIGDMPAMASHGDNVHNLPLAPLLYGFSCHLCLPSAMSTPDGAALGTLGASEEVMRGMLRQAGFGSTQILDWKHPMNRYYLATP